ncbi:hypothetical protein DPMN_137458 [Dreissena polymorpha]|uniref:Uncharacterized protein n=1 Tax=Dreissena polymorpha TaxID=45954 RepID=A0A9D4G1Y4_DREPO|nr:hypothetical protein DPMN_137456 [Dreissena polymorpha]KAH3809095.1 hypothetical protein DPMN_137458 [Dreissena polymorpha]
MGISGTVTLEGLRRTCHHWNGKGTDNSRCLQASRTSLNRLWQMGEQKRLISLWSRMGHYRLAHLRKMSWIAEEYLVKEDST